MWRERSAGVIPFLYRRGERIYLVLRHENGGHWSFPKGHIEPGEDEKEAAIRELKEEIGQGLKWISPDFRSKIGYFFHRGGGKVRKEVIYFLGEVSGETVKLSEEHVDYNWGTYPETKELITYEEGKNLLEEAEETFNHG